MLLQTGPFAFKTHSWYSAFHGFCGLESICNQYKEDGCNHHRKLPFSFEDALGKVQMLTLEFFLQIGLYSFVIWADSDGHLRKSIHQIQTWMITQSMPHLFSEFHLSENRCHATSTVSSLHRFWARACRRTQVHQEHFPWTLPKRCLDLDLKQLLEQDERQWRDGLHWSCLVNLLMATTWHHSFDFLMPIEAMLCLLESQRHLLSHRRRLPLGTQDMSEQHFGSECWTSAWPCFWYTPRRSYVHRRSVSLGLLVHYWNGLSSSGIPLFWFWFNFSIILSQRNYFYCWTETYVLCW